MPFNIRSFSAALLDKHVSNGEIDILKDYATPLSVRTIGQLLGVPAEDDDKLKAWSEWFFYLFNTIPSTQVLADLNVALAEFREYIARLVEVRRQHPEDDLITGLLNAEEDGYKLAEMELIDTIMLLFADGVENVDRGIANCVALLMEHPQVYRQIEEQPDLVPGVVEEALRINPPGQFIAKIASQDIEFHGRTIRQNEAVLLVLASANRAQTVFDNPDDFDHMRSDNKHLGLGKGRHACIGAPLAKIEMQISIESMLSRIYNPSLVN
jgi:cytochrome P450